MVVMKKPLEEYVLVVHAKTADQARLDDLCKQLGGCGFDAMQKTDAEHNLNDKLADDVVGVVLMDSPAVSTRALRINNRLVPIVVFGSYRSDPPGDVCCTGSAKLAASYLKSECALRRMIAQRADSLFEEKAASAA